MKITYYVAISADGFITTNARSIDWLLPFMDSDNDYGYSEFYNSTQALLMGSTSYIEHIEEREWPYKDKPCWVFSKKKHLISQNDNVFITDKSPKSIRNLLLKNEVDHAWLTGGSELAKSFHKANLITNFVITIIPVFLGAGISLFSEGFETTTLKLIDYKNFENGIIQLHYRIKNA